MKTGAVIAEYNIFHNGHKYLIDNIHKSCDAVIAIMSGSFVQRGDVAITDKWTRAEMALKNGVDLVLELPVIYALNTAQKFAFGSVYLLNRTNIVDELYFGSESGDIEALINTAKLLENEPCHISEKIKSLMDCGVNYPTARQRAYENDIDSEILASPNNILAIEYIRTLMQLKSKIVPETIERAKVGYHELSVSDNFASATAIRNMIEENKDFSKYIPKNIDTNFTKYSLSNIDSAVIYALRNADIEALKNINDISEGLENRIKKLCNECGTIQSLAEDIKTKRYTRTRINRVILSCALGLTKELCNKVPDYVRVLGMNKTGAALLSQIKSSSDLQIVTKTADYRRDDEIFNAEVSATDLFALASTDPKKRIAGLDYKKSPVIL